MVRTEDFTFVAGDQRLAATRVLPNTGDEPTILTLHGLGATATRHTVRYLTEDLAEQGYGTLSFEFSGNGESTGRLEESTLGRRRAETVAAAAHLAPGVAPVLVGTSMGGHLAAWLATELRPRALILFCPAAYPPHATDLPFDTGFARPGDYPDSPAYRGIAQFDGDLLIIAADEDKTVPVPVIDGYVEHAVAARTVQVIPLPGCDHFIHRWLPGRPDELAEVRRAISRLVRKQ